MSMEMRLGARGNLLSPSATTYQQVLLKSPILLESELAAIQTDKVGRVLREGRHKGNRQRRCPLKEGPVHSSQGLITLCSFVPLLPQVLGSKTFKLQFEAGKMGSLEASLKHLCSDVEAAVKAGSQV